MPLDAGHGIDNDMTHAFPRESVRSLLALGPQKGAGHGTSDMPVWGTIFRAFDKNDTMVSVRIDNLVTYLETLQIGAGRRSGDDH